MLGPKGSRKPELREGLPTTASAATSQAATSHTPPTTGAAGVLAMGRGKGAVKLRSGDARPGAADPGSLREDGGGSGSRAAAPPRGATATRAAASTTAPVIEASSEARRVLGTVRSPGHAPILPTVGGRSRSPALRRSRARFFGNEPLPEEVVDLTGPSGST